MWMGEPEGQQGVVVEVLSGQERQTQPVVLQLCVSPHWLFVSLASGQICPGFGDEPLLCQLLALAAATAARSG